MIPSAVKFVSDQVVRIETEFEITFFNLNPEDKNIALESSKTATYATSGFIIGEDMVVTVRDTLLYYRSIDLPKETEVKYKIISLFIYLADGTKYNAKPLKVNEKNNLAILELIGKKFPHPGLKFSEHVPEKYDTVWTAGHVYFDNGTVIVPEIFYDKTTIEENSKSGTLRLIMKTYGYESIMRLSGEIKLGVMGGPILNKEGDVVGILTRTFHSLSFAIPADIIKKFVDESFDKI